VKSTAGRYVFLTFLAALTFALTLVSVNAESTFSPDSPDLSEIVAGIRDKYDGIEDLQAEFFHQAPVALTGTVLREEGTFYYRKPQRLRWEYREPKGKLLVMNPDVLWLYLPDDNKVYLQKTGEARASRMVAKFLTGEGRLEDDFIISLGEPAGDGKKCYYIDLEPREPFDGIQKITLSVDVDTFLITGYDVTDPYDTTSSYRFTDIAVNRGLPDDLFSCDPPPGVPVEKLP